MQVKDGNSVMRVLHYPPLVGSDQSGSVRAGAHGDINTITLLLGAEEGGLQVMTRGGEWVDVNPPPGCLVVNMGDMLARSTNNLLRSTPHRVVNPLDGPAQVRSQVCGTHAAQFHCATEGLPPNAVDAATILTSILSSLSTRICN